jgi:hypothetical protein
MGPETREILEGLGWITSVIGFLLCVKWGWFDGPE